MTDSYSFDKIISPMILQSIYPFSIFQYTVILTS